MGRLIRYFKENKSEILMAMYSMNLSVNSYQGFDMVER